MRPMPIIVGLSAVIAMLFATPSRSEMIGFEFISPSNIYTDISLSDDGRFVLFQRDDQVYVRDRQLARTIHVSVGPNGTGGGYCSKISGNGRYVVFVSGTDLTGDAAQTTNNLYVRDLMLGRTDLVTLDDSGRPVGEASDCAISADGRVVAFQTTRPYRPDDLNQDRDIYLRDRGLGRTELVNVTRTGGVAGFSEGSLSISDDGRYVAFTSYSHELVDEEVRNGGIYVRDRVRGTTELVSRNPAGQQVGAYLSTMSGDGRYVAFTSPFWNMVPGDTNRAGDVFVRDRVAQTTERVSVSSAGLQGNGHSGKPSISDDGRVVAFVSHATNLVAGDDDGLPNVFVHDRFSHETSLIAPTYPDSHGYLQIGTALSADGRAVGFWTHKALAPDDRDGDGGTYLAWLQPRAAPTLEPLQSLRDINGDGTPEVAVLSYDPLIGRSKAVVKDAATGAWVASAVFGGGAPVKFARIPDANGNGTPELMLLASGPPKSRLRDSLSGGWLSTAWFSPGLAPLDVAAMPDQDGSGVAELALLGQHVSTGHVKVETRDAVSGSLVAAAWFGGDCVARQLLVLPRPDAGGRPKLAVLCGNRADAGSARVIVRDIDGLQSRMIWLDDRADYLQMVLLGGAAGDERLALLRRVRSDGAVQALVLDARTGTGRYVVWFDRRFEPVRLVAIPDMTGDGRQELALLGSNSTSGVSKVDVRNSSNGVLLGTVWFDTPRPLGLAVVPDLNGNGVVELALLGDRGSDDLRRVVIKDALSGAMLRVLTFQ